MATILDVAKLARVSQGTASNVLNGKGNVVIVELKQWEKLTAIDGQDAIVETYTGGANRRVVHPCY